MGLGLFYVEPRQRAHSPRLAAGNRRLEKTVKDAHHQNRNTCCDFSVIVPCYNAAETLLEQLEALSTQKYGASWEIIVADNGSTDNTLEIAKRFHARLPNFRSVDASACKGAAHARNVGAKAAHGTYLAFCDADDVVAPGWMVALRTSLEQTELAASRFEGHKLNGREILSIRKCPQETGLINLGYSSFLPFAGACGLAIKKTDFFKLNGFDETLINGEDVDFCWRAQLSGMRLEFVPEAVVHIRMRRDTKSVFRQTVNNGYWTAPIYKRYRQHGMPVVPWTSGVKQWMLLVKHLPWLIRKTSRLIWIKDFAYRWGLIKGGFRYRTLTF